MPEEMEEMQSMPAEGGEASAEQVMDAQQQQMDAQRQAALQLRPEPPKKYSYKKIKRMCDAMKDFVKVVDEEMAMDMPEYIPPEGETSLDGMLPEQVWLPFIGIMAMLAQMEEGQKYVTSPDEMATDAGLTKATAEFGRMAKDKKLIAKLQEGAEQMEQEKPAGPEKAPGELSEEEQEIMEMG